MKRNIPYVILGMILIISIGMFMGCSISDTIGAGVTTDETGSSENTSHIMETFPPSNDEPSDPSNSQSSAIRVQYTIEGLCTHEKVHNVTGATYVGYEVNEGGGFLLTFNTVKNYTGLDMASQFKTIYYPVDVFSTDPADIVFEQGKTYLLLLHRHRNVYANGDEFQIVEPSLFIPIDDFQSATMHNEPLAKNVTGMKFTADTTLDNFITYLQEITAGHPGYTGQDYIRSDNRSDIVTQSPHIIAVTTVSVTSNRSISTVTIRCRVDAVHKGTLEEGAYIDVMFPLDADVQLNQTFVLTLNDPIAMDWYRFSSKKAMYPMSEQDKIVSILQNSQADK